MGNQQQILQKQYTDIRLEDPNKNFILLKSYNDTRFGNVRQFQDK